MPFVKGHKLSIGNKGNRQTKADIIEKAKEAITQQALIELANKVVYKRLKKLDEEEDNSGVQGVALPITLKGIKEDKQQVEVVINLIDYANNNPTQLQPKTTSTGISESTTEI